MQSRVVAIAFAAAFAATAICAQSAPPRPRITGISHIAVYTSDPAATEHYYADIVGAAKLPDPEDSHGVRYALSSTQFIEVLPLPADEGSEANSNREANSNIVRLDHTAWNVDDAAAMRRYLAAKGWKTPSLLTRGADGSRWFEVRDPEGNRVQFVQPPLNPRPPFAVDAPNAIGHHIIHIGFMVHSRAAEDTFYRDLLGFRPYWWGGHAEGELDWVSQQAPDGHDWLEYMVAAGHGSDSGPGIPLGMTQKQLGSMDHLSIGEVSVPNAYKVLAAGNRLTGRHDPAPKIGRDGKYQFNLYDPDGIRMELMNFHATDKPCCSPFTAADPAE
jgi:catechol 2,3-dioxygenase-like lactoylglutathione lyase family enzyme